MRPRQIDRSPAPSRLPVLPRVYDRDIPNAQRTVAVMIALVLAAPVVSGLLLLILWPTLANWRSRRRRRKNAYWK